MLKEFIMSKYKNIRHGKYPSRKEANMAANLQALERDKVISDLQEQVVFELVPDQGPGYRPVLYVADFTFIDLTGAWVEKDKLAVMDVKGFRTKEYLIKKKLLLYRYGIRIVEA